MERSNEKGISTAKTLTEFKRSLAKFDSNTKLRLISFQPRSKTKIQSNLY